MAIVKPRQVDVLIAGYAERVARKVWSDRQLVVASIHQYRQPDRGGPTIIEQLVHRRAHGTSGVQHIINQQNVAAFEINRQGGRLHLRVQADA